MSEPSIPTEKREEIQNRILLYRYQKFLDVCDVVGQLAPPTNHTRIHNAQIEANAFYLMTFMSLVRKGTPIEKLVNPISMENPKIIYDWFENYVQLLYDKDHGIFSDEEIQKAAQLIKDIKSKEV